MIQDRSAKLHLAPIHCHRENIAERGIRTYKNHFIIMMCMNYPKFPMKLWCSLMPQSEIALKMVILCRSNSLMSAHTNLEGYFDHEDTPMVPQGSLAVYETTPSH